MLPLSAVLVPLVEPKEVPAWRALVFLPRPPLAGSIGGSWLLRELSSHLPLGLLELELEVHRNKLAAVCVQRNRRGGHPDARLEQRCGVDIAVLLHVW